MLISQVFTWGLSIILLVAAPRVLGNAAFGRLSFSGAFVAFFGLVAAMGSQTYLVKATARDQSMVSQLVFNTLLLNGVLSSLMTGAALAVAYALGYQQSVMPLIALACIAMIFLTLDIPANSGFQGLQRMGGLAATAALQEIVFTAIAVFVLWRGYGVTWYAAAYTISCGVQFSANLIRFRSHLAGAHLDFGIWRAVVKGGLPFLVGNAVLLLYGTIDIPLLQRLADDDTVGWYVIAYRWVGLPVFFASIVVTAILPSLAARGLKLPCEFITQANKALRLVFVVSAPLSVGIALVSRDVLDILYAGKVMKAVPVMQILAIHLPVVSITMVLATVLVATDRQRTWIIWGCVAFVFNIGLNFLVIPWSIHRFGNGAIGAALVTVGTEFVVMLGAARMRPTGILDRAAALFCLRCLIASAMMIPPVLVISHAWFGYKVALGAAVFVASALGLRLVSADDIRGALTQIKRTRAGRG